MDTTVKTNLYNILALVASAQDYGYEDDVLFAAFAEMIGSELPVETIEAFALKETEPEEYDKYDYDLIKERLLHFKKKYFK